MSTQTDQIAELAESVKAVTGAMAAMAVRQEASQAQRGAEREGGLPLSMGNGWEVWTRKAKAAMAKLDALDDAQLLRFVAELLIFASENADRASFATRSKRKNR